MTDLKWRTPPRANATASIFDEPASCINLQNKPSPRPDQGGFRTIEDFLREPAAILCDLREAQSPSTKTISWLTSSGIDLQALIYPHAIAVTRAVFDANGRYHPSPMGENVILCAVIDDGIVDVAAWNPKTGEIGTRLGTAACLGEGQIGADGRGTTGQALPVFRTPVEWLRAKRCGIVIVDERLAAHRLSGLVLEAVDEAHATHLRERLKVRPPTVVVSPKKWS